MVLPASDGFSKLVPSALVAVGYGVAFYLLSQVLKAFSVGTVYAIWAGVGTALVAIAGAGDGALIVDDRITLVGVAGIALIVTGVVVLNTSGSVSH